MIYVAGSGLLAYVTAAVIAHWGSHVTQVNAYGLDAYGSNGLNEPGVAELIDSMYDKGMISNVFDKHPSYEPGDVIWICYDTPVSRLGSANVDWVMSHLATTISDAPRGTMVLISSQVPVGFAAQVQAREPDLRIISAPENLRRGTALHDFWESPPILGTLVEVDRNAIREIYGGRDDIIWMSLESAEMVKHVRNAFLATSIALAHELSRAAARNAADYDVVIKAAQQDRRLRYAPLRPGPADGRHLLRDVNYLIASQKSPILTFVQLSDVWQV